MTALDDSLQGLDFPLRAWIIYAVHRNDDEDTAIDDVKMVQGWDDLNLVNHDSIQDPAPIEIERRSESNVCSKDSVLKLLGDGGRVFTAFLRGGRWRRGAEIHPFDEDFLRTVANDTEEDNLGGLPEF